MATAAAPGAASEFSAQKDFESGWKPADWKTVPRARIYEKNDINYTVVSCSSHNGDNVHSGDARVLRLRTKE